MMTHEYESPIGTRYHGTCSKIWSDSTKRRLWRYHWLNGVDYVSLVLGVYEDIDNDLLTQAKMTALTWEPDDRYKKDVADKEEEIGHDIVAELEIFQTGVFVVEALGAAVSRMHAVQTSSNIKDMAFISQSIASLYSTLEGLNDLVGILLQGSFDDTKLVQARTHLQKADLTSFNYRMTVHSYRLLKVMKEIAGFIEVYEMTEHPQVLLGGPSGTYGNFGYIARKKPGMRSGWQGRLPEKDSIPMFQTYDRTFDLKIAQMLSRAGSLLYKLAQDLRLMLAFGDLEFVNRRDNIQGSSSLPTKQNPLFAEKANALLRHLPSLEREIWDYASHSMLERTLDDSAVRRYALPEMFISMEEAISSIRREIKSIRIPDSVEISLAEHYATRIQSRMFAKIDGDPERSDFTRKELSKVDWGDEDTRLGMMAWANITIDPLVGIPQQCKFRFQVEQQHKNFYMPDIAYFNYDVRTLIRDGYKWSK